jgi:phosphoribosyl 1,2-cyclic phosphate phosphodiesterase
MNGLTITILGCGSSGGVPRIGPAGWGACDPSNPRNRRLRCSILVERGSGEARTQVLVDTSPDLREQMLRIGVQRLDGILMTHPHADHTHGIDDVRPLVISMRRRITMWMDEATSRDVGAKFSYIFETPPGSLACGSARSAIRPTSTASRTKACHSCRAWICGSSTRCVTRAIPRICRLRRRLTGLRG